MPRCEYPRCERIVREPNKFGLCHVHKDMADFFLWFSETLDRMQQLAASQSGPVRGGAVRPSGLILPPR